MDTDANVWAPVIILGVVAFGLLWLDQKISSGKAGPVIEIIVGVGAVFFALACGLYLRSTFIGEDIVPWVADFGDWARLAITGAAIITAVLGVLAVLPARISPSVVATSGLAGAIVLLPSLLPYMWPSELTNAIRSTVEAGSQVALALSGAVL